MPGCLHPHKKPYKSKLHFFIYLHNHMLVCICTAICSLLLRYNYSVLLQFARPTQTQIKFAHIVHQRQENTYRDLYVRTPKCTKDFQDTVHKKRCRSVSSPIADQYVQDLYVHTSTCSKDLQDTVPKQGCRSESSPIADQYVQDLYVHTIHAARICRTQSPSKDVAQWVHQWKISTYKSWSVRTRFVCTYMHQGCTAGPSAQACRWSGR